MASTPRWRPAAPVRLASALLGASALAVAFGLPVLAPAAAVEAFVAEGRIVFVESQERGGGLSTGARVCSLGEPCDVRRLTFDPSDRDPSWDPTGRRIAFVRTIDGGAYIHILDLPTMEISRVTGSVIVEGETYAAIDSAPDWSPDGVTIAYGHDLVDGPSGLIAMTEVGQFGASLVPTVLPQPSSTCTLPRSNPSFSPDGTQIAYQVGSTVILTPLGPNPMLAVARGTDAIVVNQLGFCPKASGVYVSSTTSHTDERLFVAGAISPDWSPDGSSIALMASVGGQEGFDPVFEDRVVPLAGGPGIPLKWSEDVRCCGQGLEQLSLGGRVAWDPGGEFIIDSHAGVRFKPDGSGDLDSPAETHSTAGEDVQCQPGSCLTLLRITKSRKDLSSTPSPATFTFVAKHLSGTSQATIVHVEDPFDPTPPGATLKVSGGRVALSELPEAGWKPFEIVCRPAAFDIDIATGVVILEILAGSISYCSFTNDPGDFVLPSSFPTTQPSSRECTRHDTWTREWAARGWGIDTLMMRMIVPFCAGPDGVLLDGKIEVTQVVGKWFVPEFASPIDFQKVEEDLDWKPVREASGALVVDATGRFEACSSIFEIIGYIAAPLKYAKKAAQFLPEKVLRRTVDRMLDAVEEWMVRVIERIPGVGVDQLLHLPAVIAFLDRMFRPIREALVAYLLDPAVDKAADKYFEEFMDHFDFCVDTWSPEAQVRIGPPAGNASHVMVGDSSPFWDIVDNGP